jgi:hypothetical protein|tara:strand:+ start:121 stop:279 length:159 start_codon:yes stop_codon:yes gene_type:complete
MLLIGFKIEILFFEIEDSLFFSYGNKISIDKNYESLHFLLKHKLKNSFSAEN